MAEKDSAAVIHVPFHVGAVRIFRARVLAAFARVHLDVVASHLGLARPQVFGGVERGAAAKAVAAGALARRAREIAPVIEVNTAFARVIRELGIGDSSPPQ